MWALRKNKQQKGINDYKQEGFQFLKESYPLGSSFEYIGSTMIVTGHSEMMTFYHSVSCWPKLVCDYRDNLGRINQIRFTVDEARRLKS